MDKSAVSERNPREWAAHHLRRIGAAFAIPVSERDLREWIATGKALLWNHEVRHVLEENNLCLTPSRFYNQIPSIRELTEGFEHTEERPYEFDFFSREQVVETISRLSAFNSEFDPPLEGDTGFAWKNPAFSYSDAMAYYCFVRLLRPKRVLEIGSGFSTAIAAEAAARNGCTEIMCIEPYPKDFLGQLGVQVLTEFVQSRGAEFFNDTLSDGDILFIDSTHTVKISSDCCHIYLRILPKIRRHITVHVHDIALPKGMSTKNAIEKHIYWTEQHLLAAYMLDNPKVKFLFGSAYALAVTRDELTQFMQAKYTPGGGSFWFELNGGYDRADR
jgi:hypothetical protein